MNAMRRPMTPVLEGDKSMTMNTKIREMFAALAHPRNVAPAPSTNPHVNRLLLAIPAAEPSAAAPTLAV